MDKIIGTNLGNWLVLEKWMQPFIFKGTRAEDETWLNRNVPQEKLWPMMKELSRIKPRTHPGTIFHFWRQRTILRMHRISGQSF